MHALQWRNHAVMAEFGGRVPESDGSGNEICRKTMVPESDGVGNGVCRKTMVPGSDAWGVHERLRDCLRVIHV